MSHIDLKTKPTPTKVQKVYWKNKWKYHHSGKYFNVITGKVIFREKGEVRMSGRFVSAEIAEQKAKEFIAKYQKCPEYLGPVRIDE